MTETANSRIILVVDDEKCITEIVQIGLESELGEGCTVLTANDTRGAEELLRAHQVEVALIDNRMPGEDGIPFVKRIRGNPEEYPLAKDVSFVLISGTAKEDLAPEDRGLFNDFLPKPFGFDDITGFANKLHQKARQQLPQPPRVFQTNPGSFFQIFLQPILG